MGARRRRKTTARAVAAASAGAAAFALALGLGLSPRRRSAAAPVPAPVVVPADEEVDRSTTSPEEPEPAGEFRRDGSWLRDRHGRYVLFRGVNLASRSKLPPYLPVLPVTTTVLDPAAVAAEIRRVEPELRRLQNAGMTIIRLVVMWKAIEPEHHEDAPGLHPAGAAYLAALRQFIDALHRHHMYVVVDFHQDIASEAYGGDGFPDWAIAVDREHPRPRAPPPPDPWWGTRYFDLTGSALSRGVRHTLRSFWRNSLTNVERGLVDDPVQTHLVRSIGFTAETLNGHPAVLGYEPFNEPHAAGIPKDVFERDMLRPFYLRVLAEVSRRHPGAFVFVEPRMDWTTYPAEAPEPSRWRPWSVLGFTSRPRTFLDLAGLPADERVVFSIHYYDPWLIAGVPFRRSMAARARAWPPFFAEMAAAVRAQRGVPFLSEFGCDQNWTEAPDHQGDVYGTVTRACIDHQYRAVEASLMHATYWNYDFYSRRRKDGGVDENWNEENLSLLGPDGPQNLDLAARPYPTRSSARPRTLLFDFPSRHAVIVLEGEPVAMPTVVFVPHRVHYRGGFEVRATASRPPVFDPGRGLLSWWPAPGTGPHVSVVTPRRGFDPSLLPPEARAAAGGFGKWVFAADGTRLH